MRPLFPSPASLVATAFAWLAACDMSGNPPAASPAQAAAGTVYPTFTPATAMAVPNPLLAVGLVARGLAFRLAVVSNNVCIIYRGGTCEMDGKPGGQCTVLKAEATNDSGARESFELTTRPPAELRTLMQPGEFGGCVSNSHPDPLVRPATKWVSIGNLAWREGFELAEGEAERIVFDPPPDPADEVEDAPKESATGGAGAETAQELAAGTTYEGVVARDESRFYRAGATPLAVTLESRALCKRGRQSIAVGTVEMNDAGVGVEGVGDEQTYDVLEQWSEEPLPAADLARSEILRVSNPAGPCRLEFRLTVASGAPIPKAP